MCEENFAFWCCTLLLLVSSSSKSQENSTNNEEKDDNLTVRYELDMNSMTNYSDEIKTLDLYEKFTNNTPYDEMQYESHTTSTSNNREDDDSIQYKLDKHSIQTYEDDEQIPMISHANSTNVSHQRNLTSQEVYGNLIERNDSTVHHFIQNFTEIFHINFNFDLYEICDNITCIPLCCSLGDRLDDDECIPEKIKYSFPNVYGYTNDSFQSENKRVDELFQLVVHDPCQGNDRFLLPEGYQYDYKIFANGSLYLSYYEKFAKSSTYCLAVVDGDKFEVTICSETYDEVLKISFYDINVIYASYHIVSIILLVSIFLVYSILPELRNVHSFMLRRYCALTSAAYILNFIHNIIRTMKLANFICVTNAMLMYYCYMASYFWLTVMSFDMWWTFKKLHSLQRNVKQREKKKLAIYSIYAWGFPFILIIVCGIMNFVPGVLEYLLPKSYCWFRDQKVFMLYIYVPQSICVISSIYLSISAALKIRRYEKDVARNLRDSESRRYNENKKWFNLYLKLFIMTFILMGIQLFVNMATMTTWRLYRFRAISSDNYYYYIYIFYSIHISMEIVVNLDIFIIFVCKKTIMRLLLKRFGCQKCHLFLKNRYKVDATSSSTCTTTSGGKSMQENISSYRQTNFDAIHSSDVTEL